MRDVADPAIDPARIEAARIRLNAISNELGFTAETNDPVLVAYFLADAAIADALAHTKLIDRIPESEDGKARNQTLELLTEEAEDIRAKIGPIVDLSLATLMLGVEKSIDVHVNQVVEDCAIKFRAETRAMERAKRLWPVMMLVGATCFAAGAGTLLVAAKFFV